MPRKEFYQILDMICFPNQAATSGGFQQSQYTSLVSVDRAFIGTPSLRRSLRGDQIWMGPITPAYRMVPKPSPSRQLSTCDPVTNPVFGDSNGDCKLTSLDFNAILSMISLRAPFVDLGTGTDPLDTTVYDGTSTLLTAHTKRQFNPRHNLLGPLNNINDVNDVRYKKAHVDITDANHIKYATQKFSRFVFPTFECLGSAESFGHRPDMLLKVQTSTVIDDSGTVGTPTIGTTRMIVQILITNPYHNALFQIRIQNPKYLIFMIIKKKSK